ncbi:MAG TPA: ABC transporter permease, partial [Candidatus Acidoferrales bacterium]|nr:ABC transporter permease [Candidatus Acidoferrales bacterium]
VFQAVGGYVYRRVALTTGSESERLLTAFLTQGVFESLRAQPERGRLFHWEDQLPGAERVAILSHGFAQRHLGSDSDAMGKAIQINNQSYAVIGVMPASFLLPDNLVGTSAAEVWLPLSIDPANLNWGSYSMTPVARMQPRISSARALAEANTLFERLKRDHPAGAINDPSYAVHVVRVQDDLIGNVRAALWILLGAVGVVLLIVCANVASLLLARAAARQKEIAVRAALGAGSARLIRQLFTESMLIALLGGAGGVVLASWCLDVVVRWSVDNVPRVSEASLNLPVLAFTLGISMLSAILFGLFPAAQFVRLNLNASLREEGRGLSAGGAKKRLQSVLVVAEMALAVVLVISAGLLLRSLYQLLRIHPGFNSENLLTAQINLPSSYTDSAAVAGFFSRVTQRVQSLPGVRAVSAVSSPPLSGAANDTVFQIQGRAVDSGPIRMGGAYGHFYYWQAMPDYFETAGIELLKGRGIRDSDTAGRQLVVVINETMARTSWPNENPIGRRIRLFWSDEQQGPWAEIVGVVRDVPMSRLNEEIQPQAYVACAQFAEIAGAVARSMTLMVRTRSEPLALAAAVRNEVRAVDPSAPVSNINTATGMIARTVAQPRFNLYLLGIFAALALVLAALGIYGILAQAVRLRSQEIGIRMALGARPAAVFRLIIGQGMRLAIAGVTLGVAAAVVATRLLQVLLINISPTDPATFAGVALLLCGVAFLACWVPARRAARVEPMEALRYE